VAGLLVLEELVLVAGLLVLEELVLVVGKKLKKFTKEDSISYLLLVY
jgi:3-deoxy-D-manno-octulosonic acid (KDO) 8-phosphate synthase